MAQFEATYAIAARGRATSFNESELPVVYALEFRNRFINAAGGAEKRQGISQLGDTIATTPTLDGVHELVEKNGAATLLVSGQGRIWRYDDPGYTLVYSGLDIGAALNSVQMEEKLIFYNGVDRNIYTEDGSTFAELVAIIERGSATAGTDLDSLHDSNIENWVTDTNVAVNDLIYNRTKDAYGFITALATASASHTEIGPSSPSAIGVSVSAQESGDRYEIQDLVELNVIPTDGEDDNVATTGSGTTDNIIVVSAVPDWTATDTKIGDWIRNTTRQGIGQITNVSAAAIHVTGVSGQVAGDSIILQKSAMPISKRIHIHFGRAYHIDSRDQTKIRISGPDNPEDMTTGAGTIDSTTFKYGSTQPEGDIVVSMGSFQRFFVMTGRKNIYFFQGTDPIADETTDAVDFDIIGLFPQGVVAPNAVTSIGNDLVWVTPDGVQSASMTDDASTLGRANLSEAIKSTLREELANTPESQIRSWHYPRRSWYMLKVGSRINVFNYTAYFGEDQLSGRVHGTFTTRRGSWSIFDGKLGQQNAFLVRQDRSMVCVGNGGRVYIFDQGSYDDDGEEYSTEYRTGWLRLTKGERPSVQTIQGNYIKPVFDTGSAVNYTLTAEAGFDGESTDSIVIPASGNASPIGLAIVGAAKVGGTTVQNVKYPLRWRGEQVRLSISTQDNLGPDTISRYTLYATRWGRR